MSSGSTAGQATDYFEALGVPPAFNLDLTLLEKKFYERSRQLHPDRFANKPAAEQQRALDAAADLNDAYRTLRDPIKRAEYMLERQGLQRSQSAPPELLEEVFELNMLLESAPDRAELEAARARFESLQSDVDSELREAYARCDAAPDARILAGIRALLDRRRYIDNLLRDVGKALA